MAGIKTGRLIGRIGELLAVHKLLEIEYDNVFQDCGENNDVDLIGLKNKNIDYIQVKTSRHSKTRKWGGCTLVNSKSQKQKVINDKSLFNKLLLVVLEKDFKASFYLIPQNVIKGLHSIAIRDKKSKWNKYKI